MGLVRVALTDVPLKTREAAGRPLIRRATEDGRLALAVELTRAVHDPTGVYWLPDHALANVRTAV